MEAAIPEQLKMHVAKMGRLEAITRLFVFAQANAHPIAIWKLANAPHLYLLIQNSTQFNFQTEPVLISGQGFALSPFVPDPQGLILLQPDLLITLTEETVDLQYSEDGISLIVKYLSWDMLPEDAVPENTEFVSPASTTVKEEYLKSVIEAVKAIKAGQLEKVVLSRVKEVELPEHFSAVKFWWNLTQAYPGTFVSLLSVPGFGCWAGASPELLLEVTEARYFRTMALAGTQPVQENTAESDVTWSQKEIEEQALVTRYIINCFKQLRLREYLEKGPRTITAGNIMHLQSTFTVDMQTTQQPDLADKMLHLLHPTSAVGGMPKQEALDFINEHEQHDRELYSGFLGPVGINGYSGLFVNLRCTRLLNGKALLYAGAGVTQDSDPEKEWQETELKTMVLNRILREKLPA